jgi:heptosyltransferase III
MTFDRFLQLWTHRYRKYSHITIAHWNGYLAWAHFKALKRRLGVGRLLIGVVRTEHFGDIVAAEPISRYLRGRYPDAHIVWFTKPAYAELLTRNTHIDEVHREFCVTERHVVKKTRVFDLFYELQFKNNNHCPKCQVFTDNPIAQQRGIDVFTYLNFGNLLETFCQTGGLFNEGAHFDGDDQPWVYLQDAHRSKVDQLGLNKPFVVLHCQSNYAPKDWPAERWGKLVAWISQNYAFEIVEIGLKSDLTVETPAYRNLCGKLSILETAEVIRRADYFIGLDSGPSHLANATGTFGIILMGSLNNFVAYNPYSGSFGRLENAVFVRQPGSPCAEMSFEYVRDEVKKVLDR